MKKQYIAPTIKCVEFKVERGYAGSLGQNVGNPLGTNNDFENYKNNPSSFTGERFGGYFSGNNEDWD